MKFGFVFPGGTVRQAIEFGIAAEESGWDGYFMWEGLYGVDPWVTLAAIAAQTERIRLGTLLTPPSRRRPWKLASEVMTLDHLSNGRAILSVGVGAIDTGFAEYGEETDLRTRAELMDESLEIIMALWTGKPVHYDGKHYQLQEKEFFAFGPSIHKPNIPIWVVGAWPRPKSIARTLKYDGLIAAIKPKGGGHDQVAAEDLRAVKAYVNENRKRNTPFDIILEGKTPGDEPQKARAQLQPLAEAGATWWIESIWDEPDLGRLMKRLKQGPTPLG